MISPEQQPLAQDVAALGAPQGGGPRYEFDMVVWDEHTMGLSVFVVSGDTIDEVIDDALQAIESESADDIDPSAFECFPMPYANAIEGAPESDELPVLSDAEKQIPALLWSDDERRIHFVIGPLVGVAVVEEPEREQ